jgi:hypothetical protein
MLIRDNRGVLAPARGYTNFADVSRIQSAFDSDKMRLKSGIS